MKQIKLTSLTLTVTGFLLSISPIGCATTENSTSEEAAKSHYTLEIGESVPAARPLPTMTPFYLNWYQGAKHQERTLKYRGWDINHDGQVDALETLDATGVSQSISYDFDFDGKIDSVWQRPD
jgi:hypothetical protein